MGVELVFRIREMLSLDEVNDRRQIMSTFRYASRFTAVAGLFRQVCVAAAVRAAIGLIETDGAKGLSGLRRLGRTSVVARLALPSGGWKSFE